ncbi:MAG TPA: zf-TFIIB domain-containing protein [Polyangiaceae bacterium]|jgi:Zn-finger nucleic acid-binding protein
MSDAPVIHCAVCGAPARAGDRSCRFCGAGIATVQCAFCFHANTVEALHCAGCGAELGPALEAAQGKILCADCRVEVTAYDSPAGTLFSCDRCGGQFVQHALFRSLLEEPALIGHAAPALTLKPTNPLSERVRYRPCPICKSMMNRKNFGGTSGVVLDVCARHGTWFDPGELPRVLEFVRQGGLEHQKLREQERKHAEELQGRVSQRLAHGSPEAVAEPRISDVARDVLGFLTDLLKG